MMYKIIAQLCNALVPICICVVLPVLIVWLVGKVKQNETNRKADIMLKALDNGSKVDIDFFRSRNDSKTIKERLLGRFTAACITSLIGIVVIVVMSFIFNTLGWEGNEEFFFMYMLGGILIAVGISLFVAYFLGKKMLAKEMEAEAKQLQGKN
ncbi:MAG: hypothetical protein ACI3Y1_04165 [Candidatus Cryptobacteroides sp.]